MKRKILSSHSWENTRSNVMLYHDKSIYIKLIKNQRRMGENFIIFFTKKRRKKKNERRNHCSQKKFKLTPLHAYGKYYITKCKGKRKITYNGRKRNGVRIRVRAPCRFSSSSGRDLGVSTFSSDPREAFVSNETSSLVRRRSRFCIPKHCEVTWHYAADLTSERVRSEFVNIVCRPFRFARILSVPPPPLPLQIFQSFIYDCVWNEISITQGIVILLCGTQTRIYYGKKRDCWENIVFFF